MKVIDSHLHVLEHASIDGEMLLTRHGLLKDIFNSLSLRVNEYGLEKALIYVLDESLILNDDNYDNLLRCKHENLFLSIRVPNKIVDMEEFLKKACNANIRNIKILPYEDYITEDKYDYYLNASKIADKLGLFITVCCTYGSKHIYEINNLTLAKLIAENVNTTVVMAHAGGARVLDAMSIALDIDNIMMDLAFSLSFWEGSSVMQDIAFCIKKVGADRILFGSDGPHLNVKQTIDVAKDFFNQYNFSDLDKENMFYKNADRLIKKYWNGDANKNK